MTEEEEIFFRNEACALTGHRVLTSFFSEEKLKKTLLRLIRERRIFRFYCGMALGFDLVACEMLTELRKEYNNVRIVACVPCPQQADRFGRDNREYYERLLTACDERRVISPAYDRGCMHLRNRYMVDRAGTLLAHCLRDTGGAASTVRYALKKGTDVMFV